jgi:hypothetical protein
MQDETQFIEKPSPSPDKPVETVTTQSTRTATVSGPPKSHESHIMSLSARSLIAIIVVVTVCYMSIRTTEVKEPLYTLAGLVVGFFFGQNSKPKSQT